MTHSKPFRLRILEALTTELQTIARVAGTDTGPYAYDLSVDATFPDGKVLRGRGTYGTNDPLPMLSMIEDPKQLEQDEAQPENTSGKGDWDLIIQGFIEDDPVHPTDPAYYLMADTKAVLHMVRAARGADGRTPDILGFGDKKPCILAMYIGSGVIRPPDDLSAKTYFWLPVRLTPVEDGANAFT